MHRYSKEALQIGKKRLPLNPSDIFASIVSPSITLINSASYKLLWASDCIGDSNENKINRITNNLTYTSPSLYLSKTPSSLEPFHLLHKIY